MTSSIAKAALLAAAAVLALGAAPAQARERSARAEIQTTRGTATAERHVSRGHGQASRDVSVTRPDGKTRGVEANRTRTGPGAWEADRTVTGFNGESRRQSGTFNATRTETGRTVTGTIETENRGDIAYRKDVVRGEDGRSYTATGTFADGTSRTRTGAIDCDKGVGCQSSGTVTQRDGDTRIWSRATVKTEDGWDKSSTVTFADGTTRSVETDVAKTGQGQAAFDRTIIGRDGQTRTQSGVITRGQ